METRITNYDAARTALALCASVDEVKAIRDKAKAIDLYARQRDDKEMASWVCEIHLRACVRIGELSCGLETKERARTDLHPTSGKQSKRATLAAAGISTSTAHRYEQMANHAHSLEEYVATTKAAGNVPSEEC